MSSFLPAGLATSVDEDPFADPVVPSTATTIQQQQTYQQPQVLQSQQHAIAANDAYRVFTITLQLGVRDIPKLDVFSDSDPMVAVFDAATGRELGRTETIWNVKNADFQTELQVLYSPAQNTTLKFTVVDTDDEKSYDLKKQDLVGDVRVDLEGLVFQSQGNWVAFPIVHRRPKSGTLLLRVAEITPGSHTHLDRGTLRSSTSPAILTPLPPRVPSKPPTASVPIRGTLTSRNSFDERASARFAQDWATRDAAFRRQLSTLGWREVVVKGDGSCFFRSISVHVTGTEDAHLQLRAQTMDYLVSHADFFQPFILEDFNSYISRKRQPGEYANNVEIQAVACLLGRNVEVYRYSQDPIVIEPFIYDEGVGNGGGALAGVPLRVNYIHENHYNALVA